MAFLYEVAFVLISFIIKWYLLSALVHDFIHRLIISVCISFAYFAIRSNSTREKLPPRVRGLPFVGLLPWLLYYKPYVYVWMLAKKYGSMITIRVGSINVVFINEYKLSKQMSAHPDFQGRPNVGFMHDFSKGLGIVSAEGALWKHQRRFTMHALKDSGMGKLHMEEKIAFELNKVVQEIEKFKDFSVPINKILEFSTCNIIFSLAFNEQFEYDHPILKKKVRYLDQNFRLLEDLNTQSAYWWMRPFLHSKLKIFAINNAEFISDAKNLIEQHRNTLDENNPRDLIDLFLLEMSESSTNSDEKEYKDTFFEDQLVRLIGDLLVAGTETSSTTIRWALLYMLHYPEVQTEIQREIDDVVGSERMPKYSDRLSLPLTVATLQEVERLACVAPASLPRSNPKAVKFEGYEFPERTVFHFNFYAIHRDPELWKNPEKFDPSRFLDYSGNVIRPPHLMSFGSGKRMCPGESLARVEIFLYFATLLQKFKFVRYEDKLPSLEFGTGFTRGPYPYKIRAIRRS